jgi:hypothetical protein
MWLTLGSLKVAHLVQGGDDPLAVSLAACAELGVGVLLWYPGTRKVGGALALLAATGFLIFGLVNPEPSCRCLGPIAVTRTTRGLVLGALCLVTALAVMLQPPKGRGR